MDSKGADQEGRRREFFRMAEVPFAILMRLVPRRYRFGVALSVARATVPVFRLTNAYREQKLIGFDNPHEIALHFILNALTRNGTRFDPVIAVKEYEQFERAYAAGKGVLVIGPHAALTLLMVRFFYDRGLKPIVISPDPLMRYGGSTVTVRTIQPSPTFFVKTRNRLRRGELICAMPDRAEHHGERTIEFTTPGGHVIIAPALMQVAARCGAQVIFTEVHIEECRLVGTIAAPAPASDGVADAITDDFIQFVRARAAARSACRN